MTFIIGLIYVCFVFFPTTLQWAEILLSDLSDTSFHINRPVASKPQPVKKSEMDQWSQVWPLLPEVIASLENVELLQISGEEAVCNPEKPSEIFGGPKTSSPGVWITRACSCWLKSAVSNKIHSRKPENLYNII